MLHKLFPGSLAALAGFAFLLATAPAVAQVSRIPRSPDPRSGVQRVALPYTGAPNETNVVWPYDAYAGYYFTPSAGVAYTPSTGYPPFMMTSINYPGVYGAYAYGVEAYRYNTRPAARTSSYPPDLTTDTGRTTTAPTGSVAYLDVRVPVDAALYVEGVRMNQRGELRQYVSPPLDTAREYTYDLRAVWTENGKDVVRDKQVRVHAGDRLDVDLRTPPAQPSPGVESPGQPSTSTLRTKPLP